MPDHDPLAPKAPEGRPPPEPEAPAAGELWSQQWPPEPPAPRRGLLRRLIGGLFRLVLLFILFSVLWVLAYRFFNPPITFTQIGNWAAGYGLERAWLPIEHIDRNMVRAAIAGEDSKYCSHYGFDRQAIEQAMRRNARGGGVIRGGSTISQQTAKNAFLWQGGGWFRKGLEAWFTLLIETLWDKRRIMEVYLNVAETGRGTYGVNAGAMQYYGHDATRLSASEAARLAAVLPLPKRREAVAPRGFTRRYGNMILARIGVVRRGGLDACVYAGAPARPERAPPPPPQRRPLPVPISVPGEEFELPVEVPADVVREPVEPAPDEPVKNAPAPIEAPPQATPEPAEPVENKQ